MWKRLNFFGSENTLKKEAGSELGFEEPEAFFLKHGASASSNLATIFGKKYNKKNS